MLNEFPLLGLLQLLPGGGAIVLLLVRRQAVAWFIGLGIGLTELALAIRLYQAFDPHNAAWQWSQQYALGSLRYTAGVDGITVLFVLITAFISLLVALYGGLVRHFTPLPHFLAIVLASEATLMGQFVTLDLLWFTLLATAQTLCVGYLLTNWSGSTTESLATNRYYQFMGTSLMLLLGATVMLGWSHADATGGEWRFDLLSLLADSRSPYLQQVIFYLLFYGLAIRIPMFPLHGWLPQVMEHGTVVSGMVLLLGVKTGIYGILRFLLPLSPDAVWKWHSMVVAIAAIGIFYSALLALIQKNVRKLLAYAVISHTGVLIIGLFTLHPQSLQGSVILTGTFGLATTTLLLMAGIVYLRTRTLMLTRLGGLFSSLPIIGVAFLVAGLSIVGMPGTPGFEAVHLLLEAAIDHFGSLVTITAALGNVAAAACLLWAFQRAFLANPPAHARDERHLHATKIETGIAVVLIAVQLLAGFYIDPWLEIVKQATQTLATPYVQYGERL